MHFLHNDALIVTLLIGNFRVSKILIDRGSSINILYGGALDMMEDTPEAGWKMINCLTQSHLYGFDENKTCSLGIISLPVHADPYNSLIEPNMKAVLGQIEYDEEK